MGFLIIHLVNSLMSCSSRELDVDLTSPTHNNTQSDEKDVEIDIYEEDVLCEDGICFIPTGTMTLGSELEIDEQPIVELEISSFYIDQYEVTIAQYDACIEDGFCSDIPEYCRNEYFLHEEDPSNFPVVCVTHQQSQDFCDWKDGRLPYEVEWELAARGRISYSWPWGNNAPLCELSNFRLASIYCIGYLSEVGSYNVTSPFGLYDVAGNVWEWVQDYYTADRYQNISSETYRVQPTECLYDEYEAYHTCNYRSIRGGGFNSTADSLRSASRSFTDPNIQDNNLGFRCAYDDSGG